MGWKDIGPEEAAAIAAVATRNLRGGNSRTHRRDRS